MDKHLVRTVLVAAAVVGAFAAGREFAPTRTTGSGRQCADGRGNRMTPDVPGRYASGMDQPNISVGVHARPAPTLVMVSVIPSDGSPAARYASGFVIRDDIVATAAHVLPEAFNVARDRIFVECGGARIAGTYLYADYGQEVLLIGASCGPAGVGIDTTPLDWTEELRFSAFDFTLREQDGAQQLERATPFTRPTSFIPSAHLGMDESRFEEPAKRVWREIRSRHLPEPVAITGAMRRGGSGGPVYRAATGDVVGIAIIHDRSYDRTFIVPATTLHAALRSARID